MTLHTFILARRTALLALTLGCAAAHAHTGHGTSGLMEGLEHPFGFDHLLAMVAVGLWSVSALPREKVWQGPATFMSALVIGAALGAAGFTFPYLENLVSLSVVLLGALLVVAGVKKFQGLGLPLIAISAAFHGLAHGTEAPAFGFAAYAAGFLLTTAMLHVGGAAFGLGLHKLLSEQASKATGLLGVMCSGTGILLYSRLA